MSTWKRDAASGLVVLIPILVTAYIIAFLYWQLADLPLLQAVDPPIIRVLLIISVFTLLILTVGYLMRTTVGALIETSIDSTMNRLPGLRIVYNASKMAVETTVSGPTDLQKPVKVDTWTGSRMTAFKTGTTAPDGRDILFIPTSPNPTTGFVVEVDTEDIIEVDETVEDALTRVLSCGFGDAGERAIPIDGAEESPSESTKDLPE